MKKKLGYLFAVLVLGGLLLSPSPAEAAPGCGGFNWRSGDFCHFEAPAGAFAFNGIATAAEGEYAWVRVEVIFNGLVIAQCFSQGISVASCNGSANAFAPTLPHMCRVTGTGGPHYGCADPPALPRLRG